MVACKADVWDPMEWQTEIRDVVRRPDTKKLLLFCFGINESIQEDKNRTKR